MVLRPPTRTTADDGPAVAGATVSASRATRSELALLFLRLGFTAFGGPAAAAAFLDGVNVAALALMAVVTVQPGRTALVDGIAIAIAVASAVLLIRFRVNTTWLIAGGALLGAVARVGW